MHQCFAVQRNFATVYYDYDFRRIPQIKKRGINTKNEVQIISSILKVQDIITRKAIFFDDISIRESLEIAPLKLASRYEKTFDMRKRHKVKLYLQINNINDSQW